MPPPPVLVVDAVTFRYGTGAALGPLSLSLGPGLHRLSGSNGAGKSTLLRCLSGDLTPDDGRVRVLGKDPVRDPAARLLIGQSPYPDDLPDFLDIGRCLQGLAAFRHCPDWFAGALADALELPLDLGIGRCSAGQRRKAGLLAAFVGDPPVLLLDEPWAALDASAIDVVTETMTSLAETRVVLFVTHGDCPLRIDSEHVLARPTDR